MFLEINEIFCIKNIIIYLIIINILGFFLMWRDKQLAKKGSWRISEKTLLIVALLGGSIGSIIGMFKFRHKTKHLKFKIGLPIILILQIISLILLKYI